MSELLAEMQKEIIALVSKPHKRVITDLAFSPFKKKWVRELFFAIF
ncbi:MAG: hypothetical protein ACTSSK_16140 [Candidatus Heimdallarchaeota archaeon]